MEDNEDAPGGPAPGWAGDPSLGRWVGTVRASGELVRSNTVPVIERIAAVLEEELGSDSLAGGAVAARHIDHLVVTGAGADLTDLDLEDFVEVMDYDPVRHQAIVVGVRNAPEGLPVLWLVHRVYPAAMASALLPVRVGEGALRVEREVPGSFEQAMVIAKALKDGGTELAGPAGAALEGVGTVLVMPQLDDPSEAVRAALERART